MAIKKCKCGKDYEDEGFKTMCSKCYAISKNGFKKPNTVNKDKDIHKQVFLKVASEQIKGTADKLVAYAKQLEIQYNNWV